MPRKRRSKHPAHSVDRAIEAAERDGYEPEPPTESERHADLLLLAAQIERHGFDRYAAELAGSDVDTMMQLLELLAGIVHENHRLTCRELF